MIRVTLTVPRTAWRKDLLGPARVSRRALPFIALVSILAIAPASGQDPRSAARDACLDDYKRLCSSVSRGGGRIRKCMLDNSDRLSAQCKAALATRSKAN